MVTMQYRCSMDGNDAGVARVLCGVQDFYAQGFYAGVLHRGTMQGYDARGCMQGYNAGVRCRGTMQGYDASGCM